MRRLIPNLIIAALLAGSVVAYAELGGAGLRGDPPAARAKGKSARHPLVQGNVEGLYPGSAQRMGVEVRNDYPRPITVRRVRVIAHDAGPGCTRENLWAQPFRGRRLIGARQTLRVTVEIGMHASAPNACQGARFPLRFKSRSQGGR